MSDKFSILMDLQNDVVHVIMTVFGLHIAVTHVYDHGEAIKHISSVEYFRQKLHKLRLVSKSYFIFIESFSNWSYQNMHFISCQNKIILNSV